MGLDGQQMVIGCCYTHSVPLNCKTIPRAFIFKLEDERSSSSLSPLLLLASYFPPWHTKMYHIYHALHPPPSTRMYYLANNKSWVHLSRWPSRQPFIRTFERNIWPQSRPCCCAYKLRLPKGNRLLRQRTGIWCPPLVHSECASSCTYMDQQSP